MIIQDECTINIAEDYTETPGGRYRSDGKYSGEEFRERYLEPMLERCDKITVILDGVFGYATSFLDEAFGGLARKYGKNKVLEKFIYISKEDPLLIDRIKKYIGEI